MAITILTLIFLTIDPYVSMDPQKALNEKNIWHQMIWCNEDAMDDITITEEISYDY